MILGTELSACGRYRYRLTRTWDVHRAPLTFVMLNPSTADAYEDDPTIRRCVGFARREGAGGLVVVNLYALRAVNPSFIKVASEPVGAYADDVLIAVALAIGRRAQLQPIVCAWGVGAARERVEVALELLNDARADLVCLGTTKDGHPRHPLYVKADQPFEPYAP